jgi:outer membrane receptor protein involved in Fe transport
LLDLSYPVLDKLNLELGATHEIRTSNAYNTYLVLENQVISENNMGQKSSREWSGFAQADYTWEILKLLVGTRYTENQQFGSDLSSRGTLICGLNESNSIKLIAGQSFRAPSFFETDFVSPLPLTVFGNPNLKPEKSNSIELAYLTNFKTGEIGTFFAQVLGYYATYDNDITRVRGTVVYQGKTYTNVNVYQNADKFSAKGVELELKYAMADTQVFLNGDCVLGDDADKVYETLTQQYTYNFKYDPKYTLSGGLTQNFGPFYLSGNANYYASKNGPFYGIPASYDLAAAVGYKTAATDNYISVKNVTDQDVDFPEYVRRTVVNGVPQVNAIPQVNGRSIFYNFEIHF